MVKREASDAPGIPPTRRGAAAVISGGVISGGA